MFLYISLRGFTEIMSNPLAKSILIAAGICTATAFWTLFLHNTVGKRIQRREYAEDVEYTVRKHMELIDHELDDLLGRK